jgi:glycosyltransferase involved in cell wall biosynthesis
MVLGIASRVTFTGVQSNVAQFYAGIDLFVLPSLTEGMPMALIEAMAAGKAVVATTVGSVPRLIESGHNGLLVPPGDAPALAAALLSLLGDPESCTRLGTRARETAHRSYSAVSMAAQYRNLYRSAGACAQPVAHAHGR